MTTESEAAKKPEDQVQPPAAGADQQPAQTEDEKIWAEIMAAETPEHAPSKAADEEVSAEFTQAVTDLKDDAGKDALEGADKPAATVKEPAPAATPKEDIWANASPEIRAAHEAEVAAVRTKAANDAKAQAGRIRKQYEERQRLSADREADKSSSKKAGDILDEGLAEFPEFRDPAKAAFAPIEKRLDRFDQMEAANDAAEADRINEHIRSQQTVLEAAHPGWEQEYIKGPKGKQFYDWISSPDRPVKFVQTVFKTNNEHIFDAPAAIEVFDAFKKSLEPPEPNPQPVPDGQTQELSAKRAAQLDGTVSPRSPGGPPRRSGIPESGDPEAMWKQIVASDPDANSDNRLKRRA